MTHGINIKCHYAKCSSAEYRILFIIMLNVIMLSVIMLSVIMLSVIMLSFVVPFSVVISCHVFPSKLVTSNLV